MSGHATVRSSDFETGSESGRESWSWIPADSNGEAVPKCLAATSVFSYGEVVHAMPVGLASEIDCPQRLNDARYVNKFIEAANTRLRMGGLFKGKIETKGERKRRILNKYPRWFAWPYYCGDFVFKRFFPKLPVTKQIYFGLTKGRNRVISKVEILGRLVSCGFEIVGHRLVDNMLHFTARKTGPPLYPERPTYGLIVSLSRLGETGREIRVYKLRTMHPFAEYLQEYIYSLNGLAVGGKLKDDIRITSWGRVLRRYWLDEIPMIWNWIKGDLQFVGVRPLSEHYLSLYPEDRIDRRFEHKPGLFPVIYADLPENIEEIAASEKRYFDSFDEHPLRTNTRYFFMIARNILLKGVRGTGGSRRETGNDPTPVVWHAETVP